MKSLITILLAVTLKCATICLLLIGVFGLTALGLWHIQFYVPRYVEINGIDGWAPWGILAAGICLIVAGQAALWLLLRLFVL